MQSVHGTEFWGNEPGSEKEPLGRVRNSCTQKIVENLQAAVKRSPWRSVRHQAASLRIRRSSVRKILSHPYELYQNDHVMWRKFCERKFKGLNEDDKSLTIWWYWMLPSIRYTVSRLPVVCYIIAWRNRFEDMNGLVLRRLVHQNAGNIFCEKTTDNSRKDCKCLVSSRRINLTHSMSNMAEERQLFGDSKISKNNIHFMPSKTPWPYRAWLLYEDCLKSKVYCSRPAATMTLKAKVREEIANIRVTKPYPTWTKSKSEAARASAQRWSSPSKKNKLWVFFLNGTFCAIKLGYMNTFWYQVLLYYKYLYPKIFRPLTQA